MKRPVTTTTGHVSTSPFSTLDSGLRDETYRRGTPADTPQL